MINKKKLSRILLYFAIFLLATSCSTNDNKEKLPHQDLSFMGYALGHRLSDYFPDCLEPKDYLSCTTSKHYIEKEDPKESCYEYYHKKYQNITLQGRNLIEYPFRTKMFVEGRDSLELNVVLSAVDDVIYKIEVSCMSKGSSLGHLKDNGMRYLAELMETKYGKSNTDDRWEFSNCWIGEYWGRNKVERLSYNYVERTWDIKDEGYDTTYYCISYNDRALLDEVTKLFEDDIKRKKEQEVSKTQQLKERQIKSNIDKI